MKKRFSILTVVIVGFLMMAVGVGANELYREWAGSDDFRATQENLNSIQIGIDDLYSTLGEKETALGEKETALQKALDDLTLEQGKLDDALKDSETKQDEIDKLKGQVTGLEEQVNSLQGDISTLENEKIVAIDAIKTELQSGITEVNSKNGPKHKYDAVKEIVNKWAVKLLPAETDRLGDHGTSEEYDEMVEELTESNAELKQAEEDMKSLKNQSGEVLKSLDDSDKE